MIFGKTKMELKVGIFVFIGLVILAVFVLSIGSFKTWTSRYRVNFVFNFVNGVKLGAPVRFAGFDAGEVKDIQFGFDPKEAKTKIKVVCLIRREVKIPIDSTVWVNTLGLLGEKYIEIMPGQNYASCLTEDHDLAGVDPLPMHEMVRVAKDIVDNIDQVFVKIKNKEGTVGRLLYDETIYNELETAIKNKEGTVGRLFYDDSVYKELEALIKDIRLHPWKLFWRGKEKPAKK